MSDQTTLLNRWRDIALEAVKVLTFPDSCTHGAESWYCDSCQFEWEMRVFDQRDKLHVMADAICEALEKLFPEDE
jgi:hypothetical protein